MKKILLLLAVLLTSSMSWAQSAEAYMKVAGDAMITDASQLSSNASDQDEGQHIEYLIDNNNSTFWHTDWHSVCTDQYHYLQVALNQEYTGNVIFKMTRRNSSNDHPTEMIVWGSQDGTEFTQIATLDLPYSGAGTDVCALFNMPSAKYLRVAASNCAGEYNYRTFWHAAEIQLYQAPDNAAELIAQAQQEIDKNDELTFDEDGNALVSTPEQLYSVAKQEHGGTHLNVKLMNDIDYTAYNKSISPEYYGVFDGQGHTIKVNLDFNYGDAGLFDYAMNGSTIKNLHVDGTVHALSDWTGVLVGDDQGATIENILITADLRTADDDNTMAGLVSGYCKNTSHYKNVVAIGSITTELESTSAISGLVADINGTCYMENCLAAVTLNTQNTNQCNYIYARIRDGEAKKIVADNVYYIDMNGSNVFKLTYDGIQETTKETVKAGMMTCLMENNDVTSLWRQTIGEDDYPTMDSTHGFVFASGDSYVCITDETLEEGISKISDEASTFAESVQANADLVDQLIKALEVLSDSHNMAEFGASYLAYQEARQAVTDNAEAYTTFQKTVADALATLGSATGSAAEELRSYLTDDFEPNDDYPCGSATYIIENKSCLNDGLLAQSMWIAEMLKKISATSAEAGADVTALLTNPDFSEQESGWNGKLPKNYNEAPAAAEFTISGKIYQKAEGLKAGIYELDMNAFANAHGDKLNNSYIGAIFANDLEVPVMSVYEGKLPFENAEDGVNCYITDPGNAPYDMIVDETSYVPQSTQGGAIALNGGRYLNRILVNVTDGNLKVGARLDGSETSSDWMMMANTKLYYQGTIAEAGDALTNVLDGMVARANTVINYVYDVTDVNYKYYPNCSAAVKTALQTCIDEVATTTDNEAKYQLIQKMSSLLKQVYAERMAYKTLATKLEEYMGAYGTVDAETAKIIDANYQAAWGDWMEGKYTAEEALAQANTLIKSLDGNLPETPVADLLDVKFNADGTATDVSATANEISVDGNGTPYILYSKAMNQNIWCESNNNSWGQDGGTYFCFTMTDDLWSHFTDGVTFEAYVRPHNVGSSWIGLISYEQSGGLGLITDAGKWCIEAHVGGGYKEAYAAEPVADEWIHLTGVWDKEAGKLMTYVNGNLAAEAAGAGDLSKPNTQVYKMYIGGDLDGGATGHGQAAFSGDIAIARIYDAPLTADQIRRLWVNARDMNTGVNEHDCDYPDYVDEDEDGIQIVKTGQIISNATIQGIYNLMGQKLSKAQRGINIINGEKVLVK